MADDRRSQAGSPRVHETGDPAARPKPIGVYDRPTGPSRAPILWAVLVLLIVVLAAVYLL